MREEKKVRNRTQNQCVIADGYMLKTRRPTTEMQSYKEYEKRKQNDLGHVVFIQCKPCYMPLLIL
jgi:hypothetical protein